MFDRRTDGSIAEPLVAALITPPGRGALATVAVRGDGAAAAVACCLRSSHEALLRRTARGRLWVRRWGDTGGEPVVIYVRGPSDVEVHCHGGSMPAETIVRDLESAGATRATPATLIRSYCAGPIEAEAMTALAQATTLRAAEILLGQLHGSLSRAIGELQSSLAQNDLAAAQCVLSDLLARAAIGLHLVNPWRVAIVGRPNVGKSSLLNAIVGFERAIVHATPGTTRDLVTAQTAIDGWPVELIDSAGIRSGADAIESAGIDRARQAIESSDLQIVVLDRSQPLMPEDHEIIRMCRQASLRTRNAPTFLPLPPSIGIYTSSGIAAPSPPSAGGEGRGEGGEESVCGGDRTIASSVSARPLVVGNKTDLPAAWASVATADGFVAVSASVGTGISDLVTRLAMCLVPSPPTPHDAVPFTARQAVALQDAERYLHDGATTTAIQVLAGLSHPA
jgi:tRNA modification GTPase